MLEEIKEGRNFFTEKAAQPQTEWRKEDVKAHWSVQIREQLGLLALCDVGLGPNQSDDTFEILSSFLVNQLSPFTAASGR